MRNNLPISGREYVVRPDQSLISRTDTSGNINYVNKDFIAVSGFSEEELLGAPHNIVRHPDMPVEAFADMWRALKAGRSWTGMVKNRRKNGDHYWVQANATPIFEGDAVIGYTSVRTVPTRSQIEAAEAAYKKFTTGNARGLTIENGSVIRTGLPGMIAKLGRLGVAGKIRLALLVLCCAIAGLGAVALTGMESINRSLVAVYEDRTVPMGQLDTVVRLLNRNEIEILQAIVSTSVEDVKSSERQVAENASNIGKTWAAYRTTKLTEKERILAEKFEKDYQAYSQGALKSTLTALSKADFDEAKRLQKEVMRPTFEPLRRDINELLQLQLTVAKEEAQAARAQYSAFKIGVVIAILAAGAFSALMGWYLARAIVGPLRKAVDVAKQIAACNLTAEIRIQSRDETADLLHALRVMQLSLGNIVQRVRESAGVIASNAAEIATGNMDLSSRTEQQASSLEETASSMEELTATVKHNAERSAMAGDLVKQAQDTATIGGNAMEKVVATMESITERSRRVTDIIGVIDGIAFQTNLLALNAAVEAARAGEQGRGFAVVAGEVRSLAQRSAAAAKEIKDLINDSVAQTELGSNEVIHTQQTMGSVMTSVSKVSELMSEIASASREQASGIEQVGLAVTHLDDVTQQNAALVEQAAAASENLQQNGANLLQEFEVFRVTAGSGAHKSKVPAARLAA